MSSATSLVHRHPLQRLDSPSRGLSAALHVAGLVSFAESYRFLLVNPNAISVSYGGHFQYLTILGLTVATASFVSGLLADITLSPVFFRIKNGLSITSCPLEVLISILYWVIRAINPKLVLPDWLPPLPLKDDLGMHAAPAVLLTLDLLFFSPPWTIGFVPALALSNGIAFAYWFWIEECYTHNQFWPYPIFATLDTVGRIGLFATSAFIMTGSTMGLKALYSAVNGKASRKERPGNVKGQ